MIELIQKGYIPEQSNDIGTRFVIGNNHLGYRGTLEEDTSLDNVSLNVVGFYDQYENKWRESVNMPNPFFIRVFSGNEQLKTKNESISHTVKLDLSNGVYYRETIFDKGIIESKRFASCVDTKLISESFIYTAKKDGNYRIKAEFDENIYDINGPHFKEKNFSYKDGLFIFRGQTNENKTGVELLKITSDSECLIDTDSKGIVIEKKLKKGESISLYIYAYVLSSFLDDNLDDYSSFINEYSKGFDYLENEHSSLFNKKFTSSRIIIKGDDDLQEALDYSDYMLTSCSFSSYITSIPARGFSGQTYKGAAFWDSEIFLLPFYLLHDLQEARRLIVYRLHSLNNAMKKSYEFGYEGAFYAWESQENGKEACSKYNVTDPTTHKPIRTYFVDKQIHISSDIAYALDEYIKMSGDYSVLFDGGLDVLSEISRFYFSYSVLENDGKYHLNDVIGPDEYHERVDDNSFTSYMAYNSLDVFISLFEKVKEAFPTELTKIPNYLDIAFEYGKTRKFIRALYLPKVDKSGILEQFKGYLSLEDCTVEDVRKRLTSSKEYWGGSNGPASKTRVIKQADVIALMVLLKDMFSKKELSDNYDFYSKYTEHGSSLSASMYSLAASFLNKKEESYSFLKKSSSVDLKGSDKNFAGDIYIGGTHMASHGGNYLCVIYGFAGLQFKDYKPILNPCLPDEISELSFKFEYMSKTYKVQINKDGGKLEETKEDDLW